VDNAARQDALPVSHPCHGSGEPAVADGGGQTSDRSVRSRPLLTSRGRRRVLPDTEKVVGHLLPKTRREGLSFPVVYSDV
jgi:hypothetical protein